MNYKSIKDDNWNCGFCIICKVPKLVTNWLTIVRTGVAIPMDPRRL